MFHKKTLLTLLVLGLVLSAGIFTASAFSGRWNWNGERPAFDLLRFGGQAEQHQAMLENHQAIQEAIENGDYAVWSELMSNYPMKDKMGEIITEENFDQFVQIHQLKKNGDYEGAQAIAEELGLPGMRGRLGMGRLGMGKLGKFMKDYRFEDKNGDGFCDNLDLEVE